MSTQDIRVKISAVTNGFDEAISKVEASLSKLNSTGQGVGATAKKWGDRFTAAGKALMPASIAAGALTGASIKLGSTYQAQMGKVQAISGATGREMQTLKKSAMDATRGTKFTAIEAGQAYEYMGMAGWKSGQMVSGLRPILNLAAASGESLGKTSDIVTDSLTAFGLSAKQTGMFTDVLAAASTASNTNVGLMGETFKYAAPVAGALGYNVKDVAIATGLMANAGIKGSQAGTTLRSALTNLVSPTKNAAAIMKDLGIHTVDSQGKMLPLRNVIDQLRGSFRGLSKDQQANVAQTLFGKEAMSGMLAIINASDADYKKLTKSIDGSSGAAARMAKTMGDAAPIETAMASIKNSLISVGEVIMPVVAKVAQGVASLAQAFTALPTPIKAGIAGVVGLIAVAGPLLMLLGSIGSAIAGISTVAAALGVSTVALVSGFGLVIAIIAAVVAAGYALYSNWDTIKAKAAELGAFISSAWNGLVSTVSEVWSAIATALTDAWDTISTTATTIWGGIATALAPIWDAITEVWGTVWAAISEVLSTVWAAIVEVGSTIFSGVAEVLTTIWDAISEVWSTVWAVISAVLTAAWNGLVSAATAIWGGISSFLAPIWAAISSVWAATWNAIKSVLVGIWGVIKAAATTHFNIIKTVISTVWNMIKTITAETWNGIKASLTAIWNGIKSIVTATWNTIKTIISTAWNVIKTLTTGVWNAIKALLTGNFGAIRGIAQSTFTAIQSLVTAAWNSIKSNTMAVWNAIKSTVTSVLNAIKSTFVNIFNGIKSAAQSGINNVKSTIVNGMNSAKSAVSGMVGGFVSAGRNLVAGIARGIVSGIGGVISAAVSAVKRAISAAKSAAGIHSPSRVMRDEVGRWLPAGMAVGISTNVDSVKNAMQGLSEYAIDAAAIGADDIADVFSSGTIKAPDVAGANYNVSKDYTFNLRLGNKTFKAFAKDVGEVNDRELDLEEYAL